MNGDPSQGNHSTIKLSRGVGGKEGGVARFGRNSRVQLMVSPPVLATVWQSCRSPMGQIDEIQHGNAK